MSLPLGNFQNGEIKKFVVIPLILAALAGWHVFILVNWLSRDGAPTAWDESAHLGCALHYNKALKTGNFSALLHPPHYPANGPYPPLAHFLMAKAMDWFPTTGSPEHAAALANLFFIFLMGLGAFLIASDWWDEERGAAAAFLTTLMPPVLAASHFAMLDLGLAAWVVFAYACWEKSNHFFKTGWSAAAGIALAGGFLTKWSFGIYTLPIFVDLAWQILSALRQKNGINSLLAGTAAFIISAPWYIVNIVVIVPRLFRAVSAGVGEGDPAVLSLASWLWYPSTALQQLYVPGVVAGVLGLLWLLLWSQRSFGVLFAWLVCGYVSFSLVRNKDPRYLLPFLTVLPIAAASLPFRIPPLLAAAALAFSGWSLWAPSNRYGNPPQAEAWPLEDIVQKAASVRLSPELSVMSVASNHKYLNGSNLRWTVEKLDLSEKISVRTRTSQLGRLAEFVLVKTGDLGPAYAVEGPEKLRREIMSSGGWFRKSFKKIGQWNLPDKSEVILFQRFSKENGKMDPAFALPALSSGMTLENFRLSSSSDDGSSFLLGAKKIKMGGLELKDVEVFVSGFHAARDDGGNPRLLSLRRMEIRSARWTDTAASAFLRERVKNISDGKIKFLPENRVEASGVFKKIPVFAAAEMFCLPGDPQKIRIKLLEIRIAGFTLPKILCRSFAEKSILLRPSPSMPFAIKIAGLKTSRDAAGEGVLDVR